jgi:hypothetical protein
MAQFLAHNPSVLRMRLKYQRWESRAVAKPLGAYDFNWKRNPNSLECVTRVNDCCQWECPIDNPGDCWIELDGQWWSHWSIPRKEPILWKSIENYPEERNIILREGNVKTWQVPTKPLWWVQLLEKAIDIRSTLYVVSNGPQTLRRTSFRPLSLFLNLLSNQRRLLSAIETCMRMSVSDHLRLPTCHWVW